MQRKVTKPRIDVRKFFHNNTSTILTCVGAVGVIATSVLAVRATPKAIERIKNDSRKNHDGDPYAYTNTEAVRSAWTCYIPAAIMGTSTIVCIFGANVFNKRQQAAISSAYALLNTSYHDYKQKLKELYGEEAHQIIVDSIVRENCKDVYLTSVGLCSCSTLDFEEHNPEDERLFYDTFSKRYFESTVNRVIQAEYHLNRNFTLSGHLPVNDFYEFLGLELIEGGDEIGWSWEDGLYWIDFAHHKTVLDDGLEVYIIDLEWLPTTDWDSE